VLFRRYLREIQYGGRQIQYGGHENGRLIEFIIDLVEITGHSMLDCHIVTATHENMVVTFEMSFLSALTTRHGIIQFYLLTYLRFRGRHFDLRTS